MARTSKNVAPIVAKIEKTATRGRKANPSAVPKVQAVFGVDARLMAGVDEMIENQAIKPSRAAVFAAALEKFLSANGVDWANIEVSATERRASMQDAAE